MVDSRQSNDWKQRTIEHRDAGRFSAALLAIERHFDRHPDDSWTWFEFASLLIHVGRLDDAAKLLSDTEPGSDDDLRFPLLSVRINLCKARGNSRDEEKWSRVLMNEMPGQSHGYIYLGCCLARQGKLIEAEETLRRGTECEGAPEEAFFNLGNVLCALERFADAKNAMENALRLDPDYAVAKTKLDDIVACLQIQQTK